MTRIFYAVFEEYKGSTGIPSKVVEKKRAAFESEVNRLVTLGRQVFSTLGLILTGPQMCRLVCMTYIFVAVIFLVSVPREIFIRFSWPCSATLNIRTSRAAFLLLYAHA